MDQEPSGLRAILNRIIVNKFSLRQINTAGDQKEKYTYGILRIVKFGNNMKDLEPLKIETDPGPESLKVTGPSGSGSGTLLAIGFQSALLRF
jgi:hypothetical protein